MESLITLGKILAGGIGGAVITNLWSKFNNKMQKMDCVLLDEDIISKIPIITEAGEHKNIHTKIFSLINTTNKDIEYFKIIFEFDIDAKILKNDTFCKTGKNKIKGKISKPNEVVFGVKKFNRDDEIKFNFDIANITNNHYNVTESDCMGFKIKVKVKKISGGKIQSQIVTKETLSK